jgi:hypothetical protein
MRQPRRSGLRRRVQHHVQRRHIQPGLTDQTHQPTKDFNISSQSGALLGALFFLGYFLFQIPGTQRCSRVATASGAAVPRAWRAIISATTVAVVAEQTSPRHHTSTRTMSSAAMADAPYLKLATPAL